MNPLEKHLRKTLYFQMYLRALLEGSHSKILRGIEVKPAQNNIKVKLKVSKNNTRILENLKKATETAYETYFGSNLNLIECPCLVEIQLKNPIGARTYLHDWLDKNSKKRVTNPFTYMSKPLILPPELRGVSIRMQGKKGLRKSSTTLQTGNVSFGTKLSSAKEVYKTIIPTPMGVTGLVCTTIKDLPRSLQPELLIRPESLEKLEPEDRKIVTVVTANEAL